MVRAFLAIDLPENIKRDLSQISKEVPLPKGKFKWVEEENFHITLKFLGNIKESQIKKIEEICQEIAKNFKEFEIVLGDLGSFPERGKPRVLWMGLQEGADTLKKLAKALQKILKEHKVVDAVEECHPHITLLRVREIEDEGEFADFMKKLTEAGKSLKGITLTVEEITLFKSDLTSRGPNYTPLFKVRLARQ